METTKTKIYNLIILDKSGSMNSIKEQYEEYFTPAEPNKPQFGSPDSGSMPKGNTKPSIEDIWFKK